MKKRLSMQPLISYILCLTISLIFVCVDISANPLNTVATKPKPIELEKLTPETIMHENPGCPENSLCNSTTGLRLNKWYEFLKSAKNNLEIENYIKNTGIPMPAWSTAEKFANEEIIVWDSHCQNHNLKGNKIKEVIVFNKGSLQENSTTIYEDLFILNTENIITDYRIPRNERPIYMDGTDIVFIKEENDRYLGIKLDTKGNINVTDLITPLELPSKIDCPEILIKKFNANKNDKKIYQSYQCQTIWNIQNKKLYTILYHIACI